VAKQRCHIKYFGGCRNDSENILSQKNHLLSDGMSTYEHICWQLFGTYDSTIRANMITLYGHLCWHSTSTYYDTLWALVLAQYQHLL